MSKNTVADILHIDAELCDGCGDCVPLCPFSAIEISGGIAQITDNCTACSACIEACPKNAIISKIASETPSKKLTTTEYEGIWVICETRRGYPARVGFELLAAGRSLADARKTDLVAVVAGYKVKQLAREYIAYGADRVLSADAPSLADFDEANYTTVLAKLIEDGRPEIVLCGATIWGRSLMPRLAVRLRTGLTADCTALDIDKKTGLLRQTRPAFGGNIMATIVCPNHRPQMATVRPRVVKPLKPDYSRSGKIVDIDVSALPKPTAQLSVIKRIEELGEAVDIADAEVIIAGGKGLGAQENFSMLFELANLLGGVVGASRAAVDAGWIPYAHQVGQTGKTVSPKLYIAVGISGAVQHIVGMQSAETIIAINSDKNAPIFEVADVAIIADLFEILPEMIEQIRRVKPKQHHPFM